MNTGYFDNDNWRYLLDRQEQDAHLTHEESVLIQKLRNCDTETLEKIRKAIEEERR